MSSSRFAPRLAASLLAVLVLLGVPACGPFDGLISLSLLHQRQKEYLDYATEEVQPGSFLNLISHLEREIREPGYVVPTGAVPDDAWDASFTKLYTLRDTSDFTVMYLLNLLYMNEQYRKREGRDHPVASEALWQRAREAVLGFKYWFTDPTPNRLDEAGRPVIDVMWYWSENHILIFRTCELLAGQLFPDETFEVAGLTGRQHMERAKVEILEWLEERSRWGFTEWHSNVYYNLDMLPLLTLIEWSDDPLIASRARMVLDLVWLDVALHLQRGTFGATHGRSYIKDKASADLEDTFPATKMLFDDTVLPYNGRGSSSATLFARANRYRLPEVIRRIARSDEVHFDRQRMSLPLPEEPPARYDDPTPPPPYGLDYTEANLPLWWSMAAQPAWPVLPLTLEVGERENLWIAQFRPFKALRDLVYVPGDPDATLSTAHLLYRLLWPAINQSVLKEVNTAVYRKPDYMLSTAQDYRKGLRGQQTHSWQATFSERAFVFTNHPATIWVEPGDPLPPNWNWGNVDDDGPTYWTGEGSQPRAAQHENVAIIIYAPQYMSAPLGQDDFAYRNETHAYFPEAHFDEPLIQAGGWTFGRKGKGYVALYSHRPTVWRTGQPDVFQNAGLPFDLVAEGSAQNVWIVECGDEEQFGSYENFRAAVMAGTAGKPAVTVTPVADQGADGFGDGFDVVYESPSLGEVTFGWHAPLTVAGQEVPITGYPRFDNRYVQTAFDDRRYEVSDGQYSLLLDFDADVRKAGAPQQDADAFRQLVATIWAALLGASQGN